MISQTFGSRGVLFTIKPEATTTFNYNEKLLKVRNTFNSWKYRRLTLIGKKFFCLSACLYPITYVYKCECN